MWDRGLRQDFRDRGAFRIGQGSFVFRGLWLAEPSGQMAAGVFRLPASALRTAGNKGSGYQIHGVSG